MDKCVNCNKENKDNWFICRSCGERASEPKFTTNLYMGSEMGKRTDIEFTTTTMDDVIKRDKEERAMKNEAMINKKLKNFNGGRYA